MGVVKMIFDEKLIYEIETLVGAFEIVRDHRANNDRTGVIEIDAEGKRMFVKIHNRLSRWNPEAYAYKNWTKILSPYTPTLLHTFKNDFYGIITSPLEGRTVNEYQINDLEKLKKIYYSAGEQLKKLHESFKGTYFGIPSFDGSPFEKKVFTDPIDYISSSIESILKLGVDKFIFDEGDKNLIEWCLKKCDVFKNCTPVPTNWDFSQNNWMVDRNGVFTGLIDFENMLWGIDVDSFGVIIERYTYDKPCLREAFYQGYGLENNSEKQLQIFIISVKMAIADICHGILNNNERFFMCGRRLLNDLKQCKA
ncbi:aminoglycoside phosphotransferase family protein [Clostridium punense]